jgi:HlyD family secretion protein
MTRPRLLLAAAAVLVVLALAWAFRPSPLLVEVRVVDRGPIELGFEEEGRTQLRERWLVAAPVAGTVRRVELREGDPVEAGRPVAELEPSVAALIDPANRARLEAEAAAARDAVAAATAHVRAADAAATLSRSEARRTRELAARQLVSASLVDAAAAAERRDEAALVAARAESAAAGHRLASIEAVLADEGRSGGATVLPLASPVSGVVIRRLIEGPSPVAIGTPIVEVGDPMDLEIVVEVLSTQAVAITPGQPARVLRWGGEGELAARVRRVEPGGFTKISALGVEEQRVRVLLDPAGDAARWATLGDGFRVEVAFVTWRAEDALRVPAAALYRSQGEWFVYLEDEGRARVRQVGIGRRGADWAEVSSGLEPGDRVVVFPDSRLVEGARLAVVDGDR